MTILSGLRLALSGAALALFASGAAHAQGASVSLGVQDHDTSIPVEITSEELSLDQDTGTALFSGNVLVRQGDITMTCDRMRVEYSDDAQGNSQINVIRMFGGVTFVSPDEAAESDTAVYTLAVETVVMTGNVLVTQGATALSSDRLTYNLNSGEGRMEGNVKTVLQQANN